MIDETLTMIPGPTPFTPGSWRRLRDRPSPTWRLLSSRTSGKLSTRSAGSARASPASRSSSPVAARSRWRWRSSTWSLPARRSSSSPTATSETGTRTWRPRSGSRATSSGPSGAAPCRPRRSARKLAEGKYAAVTITHVDTSTGTASPVEDYLRLLKGRDELVILDGVCATGGIDEPFDRWGIDVLLTAPQKAIGRASGARALSLLQARDRAPPVARLDSGVLRGHQPLAPRDGRPRPLLLDALRQRDRRAQRGASHRARRRAPGPFRAPSPHRDGDARGPSGPRVRDLHAPGLSRRHPVGRSASEGGGGRRLPQGSGVARRRSRRGRSDRSPARPSASATWETSASARRRPCSRRSRRACARSAWRRHRARRSRRPRRTSRRPSSCRRRTSRTLPSSGPS